MQSHRSSVIDAVLVSLHIPPPGILCPQLGISSWHGERCLHVCVYHTFLDQKGPSPASLDAVQLVVRWAGQVMETGTGLLTRLY